MMQTKFRTIEKWPGQETRRRLDSPFRQGYGNTLTMLERELRALEAKDVVFEVDIPAGRLRADGMPYSGVSPATPRVILSFASKHGPLRLPCDRFKSWEDNLRAIAYHLEHLRMSALYGVGHSGEQYRGWAALPPAMPLAMSVDEAGRTLAKFAGWDGERAGGVVESPDTYRTGWRLAAAKYHPDKNGGDVLQEWHTLQQVKAVLDKHHKL